MWLKAGTPRPLSDGTDSARPMDVRPARGTGDAERREDGYAYNEFDALVAVEQAYARRW